MMSIVPPNFGSGAEVQATQDGARRRAEGVTPLLPQARKVVGATGFEPATPCAQGRCATRLRYAPTRGKRRTTATFRSPEALRHGDAAPPRRWRTPNCQCTSSRAVAPIAAHAALPSV